jgi:hypothetical protein
MLNIEYHAADGSIIPHHPPPQAVHCSVNDGRMFCDSWKCVGCGEWLDEEDIVWALEDGTLNTDTGRPWCVSCCPADPDDLTGAIDAALEVAFPMLGNLGGDAWSLMSDHIYDRLRPEGRVFDGGNAEIQECVRAVQEIAGTDLERYLQS